MITNFPPFATEGQSVGKLPDFDGESSMVVTCPECNYDYTSMMDSWSDTGGNLHIDFAGECGHLFEVIIEFHKGNTLVRVGVDAPL